MVDLYTSRIWIWLANIIMASINEIDKMGKCQFTKCQAFELARINFTILFIPSKPELITMKLKPKDTSDLGESIAFSEVVYMILDTWIIYSLSAFFLGSC